MENKCFVQSEPGLMEAVFCLFICYSGVGVLLSFDALPLPGALSVSAHKPAGTNRHSVSVSLSLSLSLTHNAHALCLSFILTRFT